MNDLHPSQALLAGYVRDELSASRQRKISRHVTFCPVCQRRLKQLEGEADQTLSAPDYDSVFSRVTETLRSLKEGVDEDSRRSAALLPELLKEPPERRLERIAEEPRFDAMKLCQLLQDRSRADWFQEPAISESLGHSQEKVQSTLWMLREDFADQQLPLEWAQVSLDLACSLYSEGNPAQGRRLVEEVIPIVDNLDVVPLATNARRLYLRLPLAKPF